MELMIYFVCAAVVFLCVIGIILIVGGLWITECDRCEKSVSFPDLDIDPDSGEALCPYCRVEAHNERT